VHGHDERVGELAAAAARVGRSRAVVDERIEDDAEARRDVTRVRPRRLGDEREVGSMSLPMNAGRTTLDVSPSSKRRAAR
jgi:hypothetical protein